MNYIYDTLKIRQYDIKQSLFDIAWLCYTLGFVIYHHTHLSEAIDTFFLYVIMLLSACILFIARFLLIKRYTFTESCIYFFVIILGIIIYFRTYEEAFVVGLLAIICSKDINFNRTIKYDLIIKSFVFALVLILCFSGILKNEIRLFYGTTYKQSFGFTHPNTFGLYCFSLLVEWLYLRYKKMSIFEWIVILALAVWVYSVAAPRSSAYTFLGIYILFMLKRVWIRIYQWKITKAIFILSIPICTGGLLIAVLQYGRGVAWTQVLNQIMTNRIRYAYLYLQTYGISILGARMADDFNHVLDIGYIRCLMTYGVIYGLLLFSAYIILMKKLLDKEKYAIAIYAFFYIIYAMGESYSLYPLYNLSLLLIVNIKNGIMETEG